MILNWKSKFIKLTNGDRDYIRFKNISVYINNLKRWEKNQKNKGTWKFITFKNETIFKILQDYQKRELNFQLT